MSVREMFKSLLRWLGAYNTIRYSKIYFKILKYKNPDYIKALHDDLIFYRKALGDSIRLVFDVGANHGDKTWVFRQIAKRVVSIEPDKSCFRALRTRYMRDNGVSLENIALGEREGIGTFFIEEDGSAYNTLNEKERDWLVSNGKDHIRRELVSVSTLDNMIVKYGIPDFLKIDVEGCELSVFKGLSYPVSVISFETNLPRFREETLCIIKRFSNNKETRFNFRVEDGFMFFSHIPLQEIVNILNSNEEITYDIFIFNSEKDKNF